MPITVDELFITDAISHSFQWYVDIFERAYCASPTSPFSRVSQRLASGYSVLASLPGNCMSAAARYIETNVMSGGDWQSFGDYSQGFQSYEQMWQNTHAAVSALRQWFTNGQTATAHHIYHNLNLLTDDRGNILTHGWAQQAFFAIIESTRKGVVLGLTDRDAGELPATLTSLFDEKVRLGDIPVESFKHIIPVALSNKVFNGGDIPDGVDWLLWSRLRSSDPIRAVTIMEDASKTGSIGEVMKRITELTQSIEFVSPQNLFTDDIDNIQGIDEKLLLQLTTNIIQPYQIWRDLLESADQHATDKVYRRLPPGLIFYGPPGTGKTYLARWIACSIGLPLRTVKGADIRTGEWGQAEKNVHRLFAEVRRASPCVLVMDDADDIVPDRETTSGSVASAERAVVNATLQELEGVFGALDGVLVIMTTNRFDAIDAAIKARLPFHFHIPYPLDDGQVRQIVARIAKQYEIDLSYVVPTDKRTIEDRLVERFMQPISIGKEELQHRAIAMKGYFSTREIFNAMRLLCPLGESYPTEEHLTKMLDYYHWSDYDQNQNS